MNTHRILQRNAVVGLVAALLIAGCTPFKVRPVAFVFPAAMPLVYTFEGSSPDCASLPVAGIGT